MACSWAYLADPFVLFLVGSMCVFIRSMSTARELYADIDLPQLSQLLGAGGPVPQSFRS